MLNATYNLRGKNILIVGGLGWLGTVYTKAAVAAGAQVMVFDFFDVEEWREQLGANVFAAIEYVQCDGYAHEDFRNKLRAKIQQHQRIDGLLNNAFDFSPRTGFTPERNCFEQSTIDDWKNAFDSGMIWPLIASQLIVQQPDLQGVRIVNVSSMYGLVAPNPANYHGTQSFMLPQYGMAKAGLINLTKYLASYYGSRGLTCNAVVPGAFPKTEVITEPFRKNLAANTCVGRVGQPEDLAGIMLYLLSDDSQYMTGQTLTVDGGWTVR